MVRITQPLFADSASGGIKGLGSFRMGRHGAELIKSGGGGGVQPERQENLKKCFAAAKAAHAISPTARVKRGDRFFEIHVISWPLFWRQWLIDHPECMS